MNLELSVSPTLRKWETARDLSGNVTHDLRIRSTVMLYRLSYEPTGSRHAERIVVFFVAFQCFRFLPIYMAKS